jgi:tRNA(Ile)-lysidine synthase TilS/MesJ
MWPRRSTVRFSPIARTSHRARGATGKSIEVAARAARYEFFDVARRHFSADAIALGHSATTRRRRS